MQNLWINVNGFEHEVIDIIQLMDQKRQKQLMDQKRQKQLQNHESPGSNGKEGQNKQKAELERLKWGLNYQGNMKGDGRRLP